MEKQPATRPVSQDDPLRENAPAHVPPPERDPVRGHHGVDEVQLERIDGEVVDLTAGRYGGYGGLREPDSASGAEAPASNHDHDGFDREYLEWRDEQLRSFDADYRSWRDEGHSRFTQDFDSWRKNRDRASGGNAGSSQTGTNKASAPSESSGSTG